MNFYFDMVSALAASYTKCKTACIDSNPDLKKAIQDAQQEDSQKTKYFDPMAGDSCLSDCRAQFYYIYKRTNKYLTEDHGLYIEAGEMNVL